MIEIDGQEVPAAGSLLDACRAAGADVPAFCRDPRLSAGGHCRSCLVEVDGRFVAACHTPARDGQSVRTDTPALRDYRRDLGELMRTESAPGGAVGAALERWGVGGARYGLPPTPSPEGPPPARVLATPSAPGTRLGSLAEGSDPVKRHSPPSPVEPKRDKQGGGGAGGGGRAEGGRDETHPYLKIDLDACILCRRCVRACEEVQGQFVFSVAGRGADSRLTWGPTDFADTDCVSCGACAATCPTGALTDVDRRRAAGRTDLAVVKTTCGYCGVGCQLEASVDRAENRIVRIDGAESPVNFGHLCVKGRYAHGFARHPDRLTTPLIRKDGALTPATWDEAIALVAAKMLAHRGRLGGLSSSRATNEENYLFQKWLRAGLGTNDVDCCARVCHAPTAAGMRVAFGTGAATNNYAGLEIADLILASGTNATEAHPVIGARIKQAVLKGATLIVIDPRRTELAALADIHLQPKPGANVPLLNSLACALVEEGLVDTAFVTARVEGWESFEPFIRTQTPERWEATTGVPAARVREAARRYGRAKAPMMVHGLGMTEHVQGSEGVMLLCNLALLVGAIGRPGVGVNPLRGQNNVQGAADMGCQPDLLPGYAPVSDPAVRARFEAAWGRPVPETPGRTIPQMLAAARRGEIQALYLFGEDIVQTDPNSGRTREALEALDFLVVQELFLSETAKLADVVLPAAGFLEKDGTFTNAERRVQRVRRVVNPPAGARTDGDILLALMAATGYTQPFADSADIMDEIARVIPAFTGVSHARLDGDGLPWPVPAPGHPGTPLLHVERFARGLGKLSTVDFLPSPDFAAGPLTLVTGRVLAHYNAGTMTRRTDNVLLEPDDALEIHPDDAAARGISGGDRVAVTSAHGTAHARARLTDRVAPGTLFLSFHFPETQTNAVVGDACDAVTGCPEYKVTAVEVRRA